ncbi:MAG: NAD(P)-dependent oxidoreductase [Anaerolineae bacterium]|nr:NAD(P)-dependent oxidoreductase [Anaerolineae bacterium]
MTKRVLVTGAGGFVCRHVVEAPLQQGWHVTALDTLITAETQQAWAARWPGSIDCITGDHSALPDADYDAVVHGAAVTASARERGESSVANLQANIQPTLAVLEWARSRQVGRVVLLSSTGIFRQTQLGPVDEQTPTSPIGSYAIAKQMSELLAETLRLHDQQDVVAVRLGNIYGPGEIPSATRPRVSLVARLVAQAVQTGQIQVYAPAERRDWTFAPDVGHGIQRLLSAPRLEHSLYQLIAPEILTTLDIAAHIQRALPDIELVIHEEAEPGIPPLTRLGTPTGARFADELHFDRWTPFAEGIRAVIRDYQMEVA